MHGQGQQTCAVSQRRAPGRAWWKKAEADSQSQLAELMDGSPSMSSRSNVSRPRSQDTYRSPRVRKHACHAPFE